MSHPSHQLYERVQQFKSFPPGVASIPRQLQGSSFFPAGVGLLVEGKSEALPKFPIGGIMVLAHDWGTKGEFDELQDFENLNNPTWRNMLSFFGKTGIDTKDCFFTNFFIGLRTGKSSVGVFPGAKNSDYVKRCQNLFVEQVEKQKPRLILSLGAYVPKLISSTSDDLNGWKKFESFKKLDQNNLASFQSVKLRDSDHTFSIVALVHPCYRQLNAQKRLWNGFSGDEAEVNLTKDMLAFIQYS